MPYSEQYEIKVKYANLATRISLSELKNIEKYQEYDKYLSYFRQTSPTGYAEGRATRGSGWLIKTQVLYRA